MYRYNTYDILDFVVPSIELCLSKACISSECITFRTIFKTCMYSKYAARDCQADAFCNVPLCKFGANKQGLKRWGRYLVYTKRTMEDSPNRRLT